MLLLIDVYGVMVDFIGNDNFDCEFKCLGLYFGVDWSELCVGICVVGICIVE